jgi:E3 ubiquitin-protein ligase HERC4
VACGAAHTLAVTDQGELFAWGQAADGQLGLGPAALPEPADALEPRRVSGLDGVMVAIAACGGRHSLCAATDGRLFSWGLGDDGRLGHGDAASRPEPAQVRAGGLDRARVRAVSGGGHHSAVVTEAGRLLTCGRGSYGQLGHGRAQGVEVFTQASAQGPDARSRESPGLGGFMGEVAPPRGRGVGPVETAEESRVAGMP